MELLKTLGFMFLAMLLCWAILSINLVGLYFSIMACTSNGADDSRHNDC